MKDYHCLQSVLVSRNRIYIRVILGTMGIGIDFKDTAVELAKEQDRNTQKGKEKRSSWAKSSDLSYL